jgi:hypothetical protein
MRQSEGKRTEKRPSAARRNQVAESDAGCSETIQGPPSAVVAWSARIRSSLLLKTASSIRGGFAAAEHDLYNRV